MNEQKAWLIKEDQYLAISNCQSSNKSLGVGWGV